MRNEKLENFKEKMNGKNVAIIGMGVSNKPLLKYLYDLKCNITVFDKREEEKIDSDIFETIRELNIKYFKGFDSLMLDVLMEEADLSINTRIQW